MADKNINTSTSATAIASGDSLLVSKSNTTLQKIDYNLLAKAIIEQYTGSTLAGSAQSLKSALDALNSKWQLTVVSNINGDAIDTYVNTGIYEGWFRLMPANAFDQTWGILIVIGINPNVVREQIQITPQGIAARHWESGSWGDWAKVDFSKT